MNAAADLHTALINFASTVFTLGIAVVVIGVAAVAVYLIARNAMNP